MRRFTLVDAMILLAATAAGMAWSRADLLTAVTAKEIPAGVFRSLGKSWTRPINFADRMSFFAHGASRLLACETLAILVLSLRPPRPRRVRLVCQPGTLAVATATAYTIAIAADFLLAVLIRAKYKPTWSDYAGQAIDLSETARAIAAAWLILALSGRWRPAPTWTDRLGRILGLAWIGLEAFRNLFDWW